MYPRLSRAIAADEVRLRFTPTAEEIDFGDKGSRSPGSRLTLLTLLKLFQYLHRFPDPNEVPPAVVQHLRIQLSIGDAIPFDNRDPVQRARQYRAIREYTGIRAWCKEARRIAVTAGYDAALVMARPADILNAMLAGLIQARYEMPAFSTLERVVGRVRALAHRNTCGTVFRRLSPEGRQALDALLVITVDQKRTAFQAIKQSPPRPSRQHLEESMDHRQWLESLGSDGTELKGVAPSLVAELAKPARATHAAELKRFTPAKRYALWLWWIHNAKARSSDAIARMLVHRRATTPRRAKDALTRQPLQQRERVSDLLGKFGEVIHMVASERNDRKVGEQVRAVWTQEQEIESLHQDCDAARNRSGNHYLPLLWRHYKNHRAVLLGAVNALKLSPASEDDSAWRAWHMLCEKSNRRAAFLPLKSVPLDFASKRWRAWLQHPIHPGLVDRRQLEICVRSYLTDQLQAGALFVPGSEAYADHRAELLSWPECESRLPEFCERVGLPPTAEGFGDELQRQLTELAARVDLQFPQNTAIRVNEKGEPVLPKYNARTIPESAQRLHAEVMRRMPQRGVLDILVNVEHRTNFTRYLGPASFSEPKIGRVAEGYLLTIFAIGSNMGPVQAARHLQGLVTAQMLSFANRKHIRVEKLEAARRELVELYLQIDVTKVWGNGSMVGADGTPFDFYENNLLAGHPFRYRKMGAVAYRHVADNYIAVFGRFVPPGVWEGIYVIEALQQARLSIQADTVCSDTQGQSAAGFAFARMFGVRLLPRIRNGKDWKLYRPRARARYKQIDSLFRETADWQLLRKHWKDWMQLILSVQAGRISSSTLIRQLSHHSAANPLAQFAEALGHIERTMFRLEWISNPLMRQTVTAMTNKVESYHGFSKWLSFGGEVIAENDPDEQPKHIRYNDLLASAVILQNVIDLTQIIGDLRKEGRSISDEDISFLSPYRTLGVKRFGEYVLDLDRDLEPCMQAILARKGAAEGRAKGA